jgi:hypothetical protein
MTRRWLVAWLGGAVIGVVNGILRGATYDVRAGRTWPLVLAWIAAGPAVTRATRGEAA